MGFHRFSWDLRFDPIGEDPDSGDEGATGAVPHRTYDLPYSPWAPPGLYVARLTVDGKRYEQPITVHLDPRVKTPATGLTQLQTLTRELYDDAVLAHNAYAEARALVARLDRAPAATPATLKSEIAAIAPPEPASGRPRGFGGGRGGAANAAPRTLESVSQGAMAAAMAMQGADVTPTAGQISAAAKARADVSALMQQWSALKARAGR